MFFVVIPITIVLKYVTFRQYIVASRYIIIFYTHCNLISIYLDSLL